MIFLPVAWLASKSKSNVIRLTLFEMQRNAKSGRCRIEWPKQSQHLPIHCFNLSWTKTKTKARNWFFFYSAKTGSLENNETVLHVLATATEIWTANSLQIVFFFSMFVISSPFVIIVVVIGIVGILIFQRG